MVPRAHQLLGALQGSCADLILADLTPLASTALVPPDMLSYTVYLGAFQNSSTHAGPNALSFQGCPGVLSTWSKVLCNMLLTASAQRLNMLILVCLHLHTWQICVLAM